MTKEEIIMNLDQDT